MRSPKQSFDNPEEHRFSLKLRTWKLRTGCNSHPYDFLARKRRYFTHSNLNFDFLYPDKIKLSLFPFPGCNFKVEFNCFFNSPV